jgi:hypothetical protein
MKKLLKSKRIWLNTACALVMAGGLIPKENAPILASFVAGANILLQAFFNQDTK